MRCQASQIVYRSIAYPNLKVDTMMMILSNWRWLGIANHRSWPLRPCPAPGRVGRWQNIRERKQTGVESLLG